MKNISLILLTSLLLVGCNSSTGKNGSLPVADYSKDGVSNEPFFYAQWYLDKNSQFYNDYNIVDDAHIHCRSSLERYKGRGVTIGVIDIGIFDYTHEEFSEMDIADTYHIEGSIDDKYYHYPHPTSVIGVLASSSDNELGIVGIAPEASYLMATYTGINSNNVLGVFFDFFKQNNASVITASLELDASLLANKEKIKDIIDNGNNGKGVVFVMGAGNDNRRIDGKHNYVGTEFLIVGGIDQQNKKTDFSNYGKSISIVAPALAISTPDAVGLEGWSDGDYNNKAYGTSYATPIVGGAVALAREARPDLHASTIIDLLLSTADKIGDVPYVDGRNDIYGYGKINVDRFISVVLNYPKS